MTLSSSRIFVLLIACLLIQACSSPTSSTCEVKDDCHGTNEQCVEENGVKSCKVVDPPTPTDECETNGDCHGTNEKCLLDNGVKKCKVVTPPTPTNECETNGDCHGTNEKCLLDNGVKKCKVVTPPTPTNECETNGDCHGTNEKCLLDNGVKKCKVVTPPVTTCEHDSECPGADNYCVTQNGQKTCQTIQKKNIGEPCSKDNECYTGTCNLDYSEGNGFCSKPCSKDSECITFDENRSNLCYPALHPDDRWCVHTCQKHSECDTNLQQCAQPGLPSPICWPMTLPYQEKLPQSAISEKTIKADSDGQAKIFFNLPPGTISYFVNAWTDKLDVSSSYLRFDVFGYGTSTYLIYSPTYSYIFAPHTPDVPLMGTLLVPQSPVMKKYINDKEQSYVFVGGVKPGATVHYQIFTRTNPGHNLDLNVYLVGLAGVTAANAASDPDLTAMFNEVKRVYQSKGMTIRNIRYIDPPKSVKKRYRNLNMQDNKNLARLLQSSKPYGTSLDDALHINVFLIEDFINSPGLLGISGGIPGAPTIDGTGGSGVVFATSDLRGTKRVGSLSISGAVFTGDIIAHEMGHFLGLTHTSEIGKDKHDAYSDTKECAGTTVENYPSYCPDYRNLMFPYAGIRTGIYLTDQQAHVMQLNPLMK